ncbi:hypothetical protein HAX54_015957, partial [Datura stramonium]|nr:hypothetical protein [Datura stramonium]
IQEGIYLEKLLGARPQSFPELIQHVKSIEDNIQARKIIDDPNSLHPTQEMPSNSQCPPTAIDHKKRFQTASDVQDYNLTLRGHIIIALKLRNYIAKAPLIIGGQSNALPTNRSIHQHSIQMENELPRQSKALYTTVAPPAGGHSTLQLPHQLEFFLLQVRLTS